MAGPLEGLRVLEPGSIGPGPHAAMVLADLGGEAIRVTRPGIGDPDSSRTALKNALLRGREELPLDLKRPGDYAAVLELVRRADVLIEGFRPGVSRQRCVTAFGRAFRQVTPPAAARWSREMGRDNAELRSGQPPSRQSN